jgi:hypothetical protein
MRMLEETAMVAPEPDDRSFLFRAYSDAPVVVARTRSSASFTRSYRCVGEHLRHRNRCGLAPVGARCDRDASPGIATKLRSLPLGAAAAQYTMVSGIQRYTCRIALFGPMLRGIADEQGGSDGRGDQDSTNPDRSADTGVLAGHIRQSAAERYGPTIRAGILSPAT